MCVCVCVYIYRIYLEVAINESLLSLFMGYLLGVVSSPSSQGFRLNVNVGLGVFQFLGKISS